jgi:hypothetical protein
VGAAAGSISPLLSRSSPISRRISASPSTLFSRITVSACLLVAPSSSDSAAVEWIAIAERCPATRSCSSRAIRARSAAIAWVRSISASSAVCSARSRAAFAASRWLRTMAPVVAGPNDTIAVTRPTSRATGSRSQARKPIVTAMVIIPVVTGIRRADAGVP